MLVVHGAKDDVAPLGQASGVVEKLSTAGVQVIFRIDPNHEHEVVNSKSTDEAVAFLKSVLMPPSPPAN